ncbi:MAG: peptidase M16 [Tissierellia bacterium]|nr:peptidase M16 [Tissierellia bacterium]
MKINEFYSNFELVEVKEIDEINSEAYHFIHNKTKAELIYLKNDTEIKTFGIGFATPPEDSTGVAHIVEHSVLCGSKKYKTKEPFMDLVNSSTQLFLNAMTFSDKTIYPLSTRNKKDFYNLVDVYLDAVFYPAMYDKKEIFLQEGWHYEIDSIDDDITYNGVVYSEMKGAYSDPEEQIREIIGQNIYTDSTYSHDSGGDPYDIVNLTYEDFLEFHSKYYHPSNSYIFLHGDLDIQEFLEYIDINYLNEFEYSDIKSDVVIGEIVKSPSFISTNYSIGNDEDSENKDYFAYSFVSGESIDNASIFMRMFMSELLLDADAAPLKENLLKSKIGDDYFSTISSNLPLDMSFIVKNANSENFEKYIQIIDDTLLELVENGVNRDLVDATINKFEFILKEPAGVNQGVSLFIRSLTGWRYGANPFNSLEFSDLIEDLKSKVDEGYIENYIEENILNNPHKYYMLITPKKGLFESMDKKQKETLAKYKENMSEDELNKLIEENLRLTQYQMEDDSQEAKDTIPSLEISDINTKVIELDTRVETVNDITLLKTVTPSNGIMYMDLAFDTSHLSESELSTLGVLLSLLGNMNTENFSYSDLDNEIYINTGGIYFSTRAYSDYYNKEFYYPKMMISSKVLVSHVDKLVPIIEEIIKTSDFNNHDRILDLLKGEKSDLEMRIESAGHSVVVSQLSALFRKTSKYQSITDDFDFFIYLKELLNNFDNEFDTLLKEVESVYKKVFNRKNLVVSIAGEAQNLDLLDKSILEMVDRLPNDEYSKEDIVLDNQTKSIAILNSSNVHYIGKGFDYNALGQSYEGSMTVLSSILSGTYLHSNIRAKGGAYGTGSILNISGLASLYSYMDPNILETLKVYNEIPELIDNMNLDQKELTKYIIGILNSFDPPNSPRANSRTALSRHITGFGSKELEHLKAQALETDLSKLHEYKTMYKEGLEQNYICILGNKENVKNSGIEFDKIIDLI